MILATKQEVILGTWDIGPFDNDSAADFAGDLDNADAAAREEMVRGVLTRTANATGYLFEAQEAVAAAALVAAQCPAGQPVERGYGPECAMPAFPTDLRLLADEALARIADDIGLVDSWVRAADGRRWLAMISRLRSVLNPPPPSLDVPLFDPSQ